MKKFISLLLVLAIILDLIVMFFSIAGQNKQGIIMSLVFGWLLIVWYIQSM